MEGSSRVSHILALSGCLAAFTLAALSGCANGNNGLSNDSGNGGDSVSTGSGGTTSGAKPGSSSGVGGAPANPGSSQAGTTNGNGGATAVSVTASSGAGGDPSTSTSASASSATSATASSSTGSGVQNPPDGFDQFQHRNLDDINQYRATLNAPPLILDQELSAFALAGSKELSMDHVPHLHFKNAGSDGTIWMSGFKTSAGENQGDPNGWFQLEQDPVQNELAQIDAIQKAMFDEGPGQGEAHGHYENMMNPQFARLGVGLLEIGGKLYLTNDFSN